MDVWLRGYSNWLCAPVMGFDSSRTRTSLKVTLLCVEVVRVEETSSVRFIKADCMFKRLYERQV